MDQFSWFSYVTRYIDEKDLPLNWKPNTEALGNSIRLNRILYSEIGSRKNICVLQRYSAPYSFRGCMNLATIADEKFEKKAIRNGIATYRTGQEFDTEYSAVIYPRGNFGLEIDNKFGQHLRRQVLEYEYEMLEKGGFIFLDVLEGHGVMKRELGIFSNTHFLEGASTYVKAFERAELENLLQGIGTSSIYEIERPLEKRLAAVIKKN